MWRPQEAKDSLEPKAVERSVHISDLTVAQFTSRVIRFYTKPVTSDLRNNFTVHAA